METAEVIDGVINSIERRSDATNAYITALDCSVSGGFGFFRIDHDYINDNSMDMELLVKPISNPLRVHWDVNAESCDASDWDYAFVSEFLEKEDFEAKYPNADPIDFEGENRVFHEQYADNDTIQIAEYWRRTTRKSELIMFSNGVGMQKDELISRAKEAMSIFFGEDVTWGS